MPLLSIILFVSLKQVVAGPTPKPSPSNSSSASVKTISLTSDRAQSQTTPKNTRLPTNTSGENKEKNNGAADTRTIVFSFLAASFGSILSSLFAPWFTWLLNEKTRRFDLYKVFYDKKVTAYTTINKSFYAIYSSLVEVQLKTSTVEERKARAEQLLKETVILGAEVESLNPFLNEEAFEQISTCSEGLYTIIDKVDRGESDISQALREWDEDYKSLNITFRKQLHVKAFDELIKEKRPRFSFRRSQ